MSGDAQSPDREGTWGDVLGERRGLVAGLAIAAIVASGVVAISLGSSGDDDAEGESSAVVVLPPDPGSQREAAVTPLPDTELRLVGRTGTPPAQTVLVLDEDVLFDGGSADLREVAERELDRIVRTIRDSGDSEVDVVGFVDTVAPEVDDLPLSRERAEAVADYLEGLGIASERMDVDWRGDLDPAAGEAPPGDGEFDRRIEIRIDDTGAPAAGGEPVGALGTDEHPDGAVLTVTGVEVQASALVVDAELRNLAGYPVRLHDEGMWLVDDVGYAYRFMPTWQNPELSVPAGARLSGRLVFPGIAPDEATQFTLVTNAGEPLDAVDDPDRDPDDDTPTFVVAGLTR